MLREWELCGRRGLAGGAHVKCSVRERLSEALLRRESVRRVETSAALAQEEQSSRRKWGHWESPANRVRFMDSVAKELGLSRPEDWSKVRQRDLRRLGGSGLMARYNNSLATALADVYKMQPRTAAALVSQKPRGYWGARENRLAFKEFVEREHNISGVEGWRKITHTHIRKLGGAGLLKEYNDSMLQLVQDLVEGAAGKQPFEIRDRVPNCYWEKHEHRRAFLSYVTARLGMEDPSSWGQLKNADVRRMGGRGLLARFKGSLSKALEDAFPEWSYTPGALSRAPNCYWTVEENRRAFMKDIAQERGFSQAEDWREMSTAEFIGLGGSSILQYHGTLPQALEDLFPEYGPNVETRLRGRTIRGHWHSLEAQRAFLDDVAEEFGVEKPSDWQRVSTTKVLERGGSSLLRRYPSFRAALQELYPDFDEEEWNALNCRPRVPADHWDKVENIRAYLEDTRDRLALKCDEDWARVSKAQLIDIKGASLLRRMPLLEALEVGFPERNWRALLNRRAPRKSAQSNLFNLLRAIFT